MDKVYLDNNIFYIDNFISKNDLDIFLYDIENNSEINDFDHHAHLTVNINKNAKSQEIWKLYIEKIKNIFDNNDEYVYEKINNLSFIKYRKVNIGGLSDKYAMEPHSDDYTKEENIESDFFVSKGFVIFLTDDYHGGEIFYVNKGIEFKPKAGLLLCHTGSSEDLHGVKKFSGNDRIIYSGFVHKSKNPN